MVLLKAYQTVGGQYINKSLGYLYANNSGFVDKFRDECTLCMEFSSYQIICKTQTAMVQFDIYSSVSIKWCIFISVPFENNYVMKTNVFLNKNWF